MQPRKSCTKSSALQGWRLLDQNRNPFVMLCSRNLFKDFIVHDMVTAATGRKVCQKTLDHVQSLLANVGPNNGLWPGLIPSKNGVSAANDELGVAQFLGDAQR
jgi:hypothetical protein